MIAVDSKWLLEDEKGAVHRVKVTEVETAFCCVEFLDIPALQIPRVGGNVRQWIPSALFAPNAAIEPGEWP